MSAAVSALPASTNYTAEQALDCARRDFSDAQDLIVCGWDAEGRLFVRSSKMAREQSVFILEHAKLWALGFNDGAI